MRNNEILRANNRDHSGFNGEFLCAKGRFGFDFTSNPERIRQPLVRRNGKLEPASWEDALEEVARRLKQVHEHARRKRHRRDRLESHHQRRKLSAEPLRARHAGHQQSRSSSHRRLRRAWPPRWARMRRIRWPPWPIFTTRSAIFLIGNDVTNQNPLVAWQIRTGVRHHNAKLYVINGRPSKIHRQADRCRGGAPKAAKRTALRWLATEHGQFDRGDHGGSGSAESRARSVVGCGRAVRRGHSRRGDSRSGFACGALWRPDAASWPWAIMRIRAARPTWEFCPIACPDTRICRMQAERARFGKLWGAEPPQTPGLTARAMMEAAVAGKLKALYVVGANPVKTFAICRAGPPGGPRTAGRARHVPDGNRAARRCGAARRLHVRKRRHADQYRGRSADDASLDRSARAAQRFRPAPHSFAPARHARAGLADQAAHGGSGVRRNPPARGRATTFRTPICWRAARNSPPRAAEAWNRLTTSPAGTVFSSNDYLFTSGTLGRYCSKLTSTNEAKEKPWSSSRIRRQHPVLVVSLVKIAVLLFVVMTALAYLTWFERKVVARIQSRWGPYYVGAHGLLQPLADGLKFLFKEDLTPPTRTSSPTSWRRFWRFRWRLRPSR